MFIKWVKWIITSHWFNKQIEFEFVFSKRVFYWVGLSLFTMRHLILWHDTSSTIDDPSITINIQESMFTKLTYVLFDQLRVSFTHIYEQLTIYLYLCSLYLYLVCLKKCIAALCFRATDQAILTYKECVNNVLLEILN